MKILFAAGGTAGHINPALAVAGFIKEKYSDTEILFVGTADHLEAKLVPAAGYAFETIDISGFQRKVSWKNIKRNMSTAAKLLKASGAAGKIIRGFAPDAVVGFGGYVSGPVLRKAAQMKIPTAIHEQNAFPGMTNKTLAKIVDAVMLTSPDAEKHLKCKNKCVVTGLPVRESIIHADRDFARVELGLKDKPLILSFGGSLGAKKLNEAVLELIVRKHKDGSCYFLHATGQYEFGLKMPGMLEERGVDLSPGSNVMIREYIKDMDRCLCAADLVISRAGASTLSELEVQGKASILIPSPNVSENHQYHNAMALVSNDAAVIIEEKDLTGDRLILEVEKLLKDKDRLYTLARNARKMAICDANERISNIITGLIR